MRAEQRTRSPTCDCHATEKFYEGSTIWSMQSNKPGTPPMNMLVFKKLYEAEKEELFCTYAAMILKDGCLLGVKELCL